MKKCKKCNEEKEILEFYNSKRTKDGYDTRCKFCVNNVPKIVIENKLCKGCNQVKNINDFHKQKTSKDGYENKCVICRKLMNKNNYNKVKTELNSKRRQFRKENLEEKRNYYRKYNNLNRDKIRKYNDTPTNKLRKKLSKIIKRVFSSKNLKKNYLTLDILECSVNDFKIYIESKFESWMTWENHGNYTGNYNETWQFDHIIPISIAKNESDLIILNHYSNFQPLCSRKNLEKSNNL